MWIRGLPTSNWFRNNIIYFTNCNLSTNNSVPITRVSTCWNTISNQDNWVQMRLSPFPKNKLKKKRSQKKKNNAPETVEIETDGVFLSYPLETTSRPDSIYIFL